MGLILNYMSASNYLRDRGDLAGRTRRHILAVSGGAYFSPGHDIVGGSVDHAKVGFPGHLDAGYIFSGSVGGQDKTVFLGDVVISGSLGLGGESGLINGAGSVNKLAIFSDPNTLTTDGLAYNSTSDQLYIGDAANDPSAVLLGSGSFQVHHLGFEGDTVSGLSATAAKLGITGSAMVELAAPMVGVQAGTGWGVNIAGAPVVGVLAGQTTIMNDTVFSATAGTNADPDFQVLGFAKLDGTAQFTGLVDINGVLDVDSASRVEIGTSAALNLTSSLNHAKAVEILASAGGIDITAAGAAGEDIDLLNSAGSITLNAGENATDAIVLNASHADGAVTLGANNAVVVSIDANSVDIAQVVNVDAVTDATNSTSGALIVDGGVGIAKKLFVGTDLDVSGTSALDGNVTISGNLDVNGTTTTIDSVNLSVQDSIIALGVSGSDGGYSATGDRGILFPRGTDSSATAGLWYDGSRFNLGTSKTGPLSGSFASVDSYDKLMLSRVELDSAADYFSKQSGASTDLLVTSANAFRVDAAESVQLDAGSLILGVTGSMLPGADGSYDLGSSTLEWRNLYLDGTAQIDALVADTADINAGTIDDTAIGGTTAAAAEFTTLGASGQSDLAGIVNLAASGVATTVKGTFNVDEAATFDTTVGVTGDLTLSGGAGALTFGASSSSILVTDNVADGLDIGAAGATDLLRFDTRNGAERLVAGVMVVPKTDNSINLGASDSRFANIFTGDLNLRNDRGDWTLIEEEDFISFRNNMTGRRFRMVMEDITGTGTYGPGNDGEM